MGLFDQLRRLGGRLGIIRIVTLDPKPAGAAASGAGDDPANAPTRCVTLKELATEIRAQEVRLLAELPAEMSVPFEKVFEAAGVKPPPHGWTVDRLRQLLQTEQYKAMDRAAAQKAVLGLLAAEKADSEDLVKDAVARDQAIDAYEMFVKRKMDDRIAARQEKIARTESQIRELQEQCSRLREETRSDKERWREWKGRKVALEKEMAWAIGFLLDRPVMTIDEEKPEA